MSNSEKNSSVMSTFVCPSCSLVSGSTGDCPHCKIKLQKKDIEDDWKSCCD